MKDQITLQDQSDEQTILRSELATKQKLIEDQRKEIEVCVQYAIYN